MLEIRHLSNIFCINFIVIFFFSSSGPLIVQPHNCRMQALIHLAGTFDILNKNVKKISIFFGQKCFLNRQETTDLKSMNVTICKSRTTPVPGT